MALALLPLTACSDIGENEPIADRGDGLQTRFVGLPIANVAEADSEKLSNLFVYHFNGDEFVQTTEVADPYSEDISLPVTGTTRLYALSGAELSPTKGMKEADFLKSTVISPKDAQSAPVFYAGMTDLSEDNIKGNQLEIPLKRGVARIDFVNTIDKNVEVEEVIVEDAKGASYIFECDGVPESQTVTYSHKFTEAFHGTNSGLFNLFESEKPVHVRIMGMYKDSPLNILTTLPSVERNKVYTLQIVNINSTIEGIFTIKDWEEGDNVGAKPSADSSIMIDKANSVVPEGVTVDFEHNRVTVPAGGVNNLKIAFVTPTKVTVSSIDGETPVAKITSNEPVKVAEGYISSFNVNVTPNDRLGYYMIVHLKDESGRYNFIEIKVLPQISHKIETVDIAGMTWMAFNATSPDPDDQLYPLDGLTVEEMYQKNWPHAIGNFFQYGRQKGYSPWTKNDPTGNDSIARCIPWNKPEYMPLPEGFHITTQAEWLKLLPSGTAIPSTYSAANGEQIKVEIVTLPGTMTNSPSASANGAKLFMRYLRFESQVTHNVLIIPICGMKTASWDEYPGGGRAMHAWGSYWIAEDRYTWLFEVGSTNDVLSVAHKRDRWNYNGFMPVRGVKDQN